MFSYELFEAPGGVKKIVVILPGGFHPFHPGHLSLYQSAQKTFPGADIYYAATNDKSERPFDFADKQALANIAGVPNGRFVQVNSPFVANEITDQYDPETTAVVFARSEKDKDQPPQPAQRDAQGNLPLVTRGPRKGQPVSDYLQYYAGNEQNLKPMAKPDGHIYIAYLPVLQFKAGASGITSATQIRDTWPRADEATRDQIVKDLYPRNPAAAKKILNKYLGEAPLAEDAAGVGVVKNSKDPRYVMATMGDQNDVNSKTLGKMMKAYHLIGKNPANTKQRPVKGNIAESRLNEFAPDSSGDGGDDGFSEETLKRLAAQWWQGDEDPRVERTLAAAGWEIGQDEGYDDEPGVFVVQAGDVNGNSYISWPAHELKGVSEGSGTAKYKVRSIGRDSKGEYYISPSTGQKVYKSGVKVGDHEVPGTKEIKPKLGEQGVAEAAGLYGPFTVTINTGERPASRTKTKKFRREDDAILWTEDWFEDFPQYVYATAEITDPDGNVVWHSDETMSSGKSVAEVSKSTLDQYLTKASDSYGHADFAARQSKHDPGKRSYHVDQKRTVEKRRQGISRALDRMSKEGVAEGGIATVGWPDDEGTHTGNMPIVRLGGTVDKRPEVKVGKLVKAIGLSGVYRVMDIRGDQAKIVQEIPNTAHSTYVPMSDLRVWTNKPVMREQGVAENAEDLNVGDPVIITGNVEFQGKTGDIDSFGENKRFVIVNLYNHGKRSFHSSDVSYNDYADREVDESLYQFDREDPYNSEFAPDVGMGRMTLRGWKQSMIRRVKEFAAELERSGQDLDRAAVWDHVHKKLQSLNLDPIAQEIELAHQQLEKIRRQGGIRSRAFNK